MSLVPNNAQNESPAERRIAVRRKEDYFWLKRLSDISGDACIIVNRDLSLSYTDPKLFDLLRIDPEVGNQLTKFSELTNKMAEQGYFGPGEPHVFEALMSDLLVNQRLKQTRTTQLINALTPCGRHIDIRVSLGRDDSYIVLVRDNTGSELKKRALDTALKVGESGYWLYNLFSGEFWIRADSLERHFSKETFARIKRSGFMHVVHPDDREKTEATINESVETRASLGLTVRAVADDGEIIWLSSHIMPNIDENGHVRSLSCFFTNVSKEIRVQNELRDLQAKAENALMAKNEFLGRLSHEVRTPMNAIVGLADAIIHQNRDPELSPKLSLIQNSAEKIVRIVDETLDHSKLDNGSLELHLGAVDPAEIVKTACSVWSHRANKDTTTLSCKVHPDIPGTVRLDAHRYEQCLNNLISNALKFSVGGNVQVILTLAGTAAQRQLVLAVRDDGIGMSADDLKRIFLPFRQADNSISSRFGGTGLGLTITKDLVELMDGKITVTSDPGEGTLFVITVPLHELTANQPDVKSETSRINVKQEPSRETPWTRNDRPKQPTPQPTSKPSRTRPVSDGPVEDLMRDAKSVDSVYAPLRVLIVDDNETNHIVVSSLLSTVVGHIDTAVNGEDAIAALQKQEYDVVLMDIHMPVMDGIEATLAIRSCAESYRDVPIIALTADPQYQQSRLCKNIGMNDSLAKPIKLINLLESFDKVLSLSGRSVERAA